MGLSARTISSMKWRTTFVALALLAFFTYGPHLRKEREQNWERFGENLLTIDHINTWDQPEFEFLKGANFSHQEGDICCKKRKGQLHQKVKKKSVQKNPIIVSIFLQMTPVRTMTSLIVTLPSLATTITLSSKLR